MAQNNFVFVTPDELRDLVRQSILEVVHECLPPVISNDGEVWYTMKEVAKKWGVPKQIIWLYTKTGRIKCSHVHVGRSVRYEKTYIDNLKELAGAKDGGKCYWTKEEQLLNNINMESA